MAAAPYQTLVDRTREISFVSTARSLLSWDQETVLPPGGATFRAEQLAYFGGKSHALWTDPEVGTWISQCEAASFPANSTEAANVRQWRWEYDRSTKLPTPLVEEMERVCSHAHHAWIEARPKSDFAAFQPHLEKIVDLVRKQAGLWGYTESPYDALLDGYEKGLTTKQVTTLFDALEPDLRALSSEAVARCASIPENLIEGDCPIELQQTFNKQVAASFGFDFRAGRIDTSAHPFCTNIGPRDVRMTTRYDARDFTNSLYSVLHETGHGLYDQGLPTDAYGTPCGNAVSLGIHESQSRLWENKVARDPAFWNHWFGPACGLFPHLKNFTAADVHKAVNRAAMSFIRVDSDELTYDLHIILRFRIEKALIEGDLDVAGVPSAWNELFEKMFGVKVPDDRRGCLQDVHWSFGGFGYFPTYTLGNLNSAQLIDAAKRGIPGLKESLVAGSYGDLLAWLRQNIHVHGSRYSAQELMRRATGQETNAKFHLDYLKAKVATL